MERDHWLGRKRTSLKLAQAASDSQAKLAHYELAGRYSIKAASVETTAIYLAKAIPPFINAGRASKARTDDDD
jgi:hypothetical protein